MGRRIPIGAGRHLTLRFRLLAAAAGIVAVSLLLAGALTWVQVRTLEFQGVQDQLDRQIATAAAQVRANECQFVQAGATLCRPALAPDYTARLDALAARLASGRLLLLDNERYIVYDSAVAQIGRAHV